ncbi:HAD-IIB family hydrolase [Mesoplasma corruscae]|uniref:Haloacid dehalogenase n=1 Tax=Mesoplasma corruscae TaxID=216874 RepID=A0A2S5RHR1_9MOLU|nr:HAD-IIB family hydrolase [Mesoplasma corruscae]PPE06833.1 haloacid dehalogenase [Mesoplasma corruscae]
MKEIKLLALDMDGTSYHKMAGIILDNVEPIKKAIAKGVKLAFVTGRPAVSKLNELEKYGFDKDIEIIVGCNGGCIYDLKNHKVLESNCIDSITAKAVFNEALKNDACMWGYTDDLNKVVVTKNSINSKDYILEKGFFDGEVLFYEDVKDDFSFKFFKLLGFQGNEKLYKSLEENFNLNISTNDNLIGEINVKGINKAYALKWLSNFYDIPVDNMAAIGDGMNDYPMIQIAGVGVGIANSVQPIKDISDVYINKTNVEGAVKEFIETYILGEK